MNGNKSFILIFALLGLLSFAEVAAAQYSESDSVVTITGRVINAQDSTPVVAKIRFTKMPNGDDVGISVSNAGNYEMPVLNEHKYIFEAEAQGFLPLKQEIDIVDFNRDRQVLKDFVMMPVRIGQIMDFDNILFEQSQAILLPGSYGSLDKLVDMLSKNPRLEIQLEGHTDFRGPARANKRLSAQRVRVIRDYLINKGVEEGRVSTRAFGGSNPLSRAATDEAAQLNRRVEIRILNE